MPTAAKLVAAIALALLALALTEIVKAGFPEDRYFGSFSLVNAGIGLILGWTVIGARAGRGFALAVSNGVTGAVALAFWGLAVQAANEMVARSMARQYSSVNDAIQGLFGLAADFGARLLTAEFIATAFMGGVVCALLAEAAWRRWR